MEYVRETLASGQGGDQELIAAVRQGDGNAFARLFERFEPPVRGYLTALCGDPELAADVAQETFLDLSRNIGQLRDDDAFAAWLYRSAHNHLRTETRRCLYRRAISLDWLSSRPGSHPAMTDPRDARADARDRVEIQAALNALSPRLREALLLSRYAGFSCPEVAASLNISPEAAKKRITRACAEFRRHYEQERS